MTGEGRPTDEPEQTPGSEVIIRPEATVLGDETLIPNRNLILPPPNRFTHELVIDQPYHFDRPGHSQQPDGVLRAGTPVVLLVEGDASCRVVDGSGLYVEVVRGSLRELPPTPQP